MPVPEDVDREPFRPLIPVVPVVVVNELRHFLEPYLKVFQSVFKQNYFFISLHFRIDFPSSPSKKLFAFLALVLIKIGRKVGY